MPEDSGNEKRTDSEERWHAHSADKFQVTAQELLNVAGEWLVQKVRHRAMADIANIVLGRTKGATKREFEDRFSSMDERLKTNLMWLVEKTTDNVLHHLMSAIEESDVIVFGIRDSRDQIQELKEWSDGLAGELPGEQGWIARFSKQR